MNGISTLQNPLSAHEMERGWVSVFGCGYGGVGWVKGL